MRRSRKIRRLDLAIEGLWGELKSLISRSQIGVPEAEDYHSEVIEMLASWGAEPDEWGAEPDEALEYAEIRVTDRTESDKEYIVAERYGDFDDLEFPDDTPLEYDYHKQKIIEHLEEMSLAIPARDIDRVSDLWSQIRGHSDYSADLLDSGVKEDIGEVIEKLDDMVPLFLYRAPVAENKLEIPKPVIDVSLRLYHLIAREPRLLYEMSPRQFEEFLAEVFMSFGFSVELTARTRDGGRDIIAFGKEHDIHAKYVIECKRFAAHRKVGISYVRELYAVKQLEHATKAILATTSFFTKPARAFESQYLYELELKDFNAVTSWAKDYSKWLGELKTLR